MEEHDIYMGNPEVLTRPDLGARLAREPWPVETQDSVRLLLQQVTEPPQVGMFERIDFGYDLRMYVESSNSATIQSRWNRLLACYDTAMRGRNLALSALADVSNKFYEEEESEMQSREAVRTLTKENEELTRAIEYIESRNRDQEKQIASLEERNRTLAREGFVRRARYDKALGVLETILADWEVATGVPISRPTLGGSGDQDARFEAIRQGLEEARMASAMSHTRYQQLQDRYDGLIQETAERSQGRPSQEISPLPISDPGSEPTPGKRKDDTASNDPGDGRAHSSSQTASQSGSQPCHQDEEKDKLREEIALWRSRCADLKWTIDQLERRLAVQGLEAAYVGRSNRTSISKAEDSTRLLLPPSMSIGDVRPLADELGTTLSSQQNSTRFSAAGTGGDVRPLADELEMVLSSQSSTRLLSAPGTGAVHTLADELGTTVSSRSTRLPSLDRDIIRDIETSQPQVIHSSRRSLSSLQSRDVIREIEAAQLQAIQSSWGVMDEIKTTIDELVKRVSTGMAEAKELPYPEAQKILEQLQKLSRSADTWTREHEKLEENHTLIHDEIDTIQRVAELNEQQQQQQQDFRVELARTVSGERNGSRSVSIVTRSTSSSHEPSEILSFTASAHEIRHLNLVRILIQAMRAPPSQNQMGLDTAVSMWLNHLYHLRHELNSVDPDTPTEDLMTKFGMELETLLSYGIEKDPGPYYSTIEHYDKLFHCLHELGSYVPKPSVSEKGLLEKLRDGILAAEKAQEKHECLEREHEAWCAQNPRLPLSSKQFGEVLRLASNFLQATGSDWKRTSPRTRDSVAAMEELLAQIQKVIADKYLLERRRALHDGIKSQGDQLAKLREHILNIGARIDDMIEQLAAFDRLQMRGYSGTTRDARRMDMNLRAGMKRHEIRLRREQQFYRARCNELEAGRARFQEFLDQQALTDRRLAEHVLTQALLKLQSAGASGQHGGAACFCTLLRYYLPRAYYSTVSGGCCAGGKAITLSGRSPDHIQAAGRQCLGHHGHGILVSPEQLWAFLCRVLTSLTWLLFLLFTQPHRIHQTASFILSYLVIIPTYLYRLLAYAVLYLRLRLRHHRRHHRRHHHPPSAETGRERSRDAPSLPSLPLPPPPKLALPSIPPASTLVSTALALLALYGWLAYVAVTVERRIWVGNNDWRFAYLLDVTTTTTTTTTNGGGGGGGSLYPAWSPLRVDFRLATHPLLWAWFERRVHALWSWDRKGAAAALDLDDEGVWDMVVGYFAWLWKSVKA
ncbi:hypothetical protein VTH82DRAFT_7544 [Thermothelomyces myriococcoides]